MHSTGKDITAALTDRHYYYIRNIATPLKHENIVDNTGNKHQNTIRFCHKYL